MSMKNLRSDEVCAGVRVSKLIKSIGLTLLELVVAIAIVGILSGIAYPLYTEHIEKVRIAVAIADIQNISATISSFYTDRLQYPETLAQVGYGNFLDPWGSPYQYLNIQTAKGKGKMRKDHFMVPINTDYDLYSMGKDRQSVSPLVAGVSKDDIIRARDGAYIGLASDF
jgi:general secretion pathway protein G